MRLSKMNLSVYKNAILSESLRNKIPLILADVTHAALNAAVTNVLINANNNDNTTNSATNSSSSSGWHNDEISVSSDTLARSLEHAPQLTTSSLIKVYVLMTMAAISLIGNIATMWNICQTRIARRTSRRHSWSAIYTLIFHLSIADLIVTGFCIIGDAAWYYTVQWLAGEQCCKLVKLFQMFGLYLSTYVLVLIGVDRWIAVKYPMKSLNMAKRCYRLLAGIYVLSFLLSLPQYFIFRVKKGPFIEDFYQCVTHGFYEYDWQEQLYTTFTMVFMFFLPLVILFGSYLSTFRTISGSEQMFQGSKLTVYSNNPSMQTNRQRLIHKAKMKSLRISVVIIFAFLICWTPYNIMMIIFIYLNPDDDFSEDLQKGIFFFGMANSIINPLIYGAFHLCPTNRKATNSYKNNNNNSKNKNNKNSLTRGDSQRNPSFLTAITQIETNHNHTHAHNQHPRNSRLCRQASPEHTTYSNGCPAGEREYIIGLLPATSNAPKMASSAASNASLSLQRYANTLEDFREQDNTKLLSSTMPAEKIPLQGGSANEVKNLCTLSNLNGTKVTTQIEENGIDKEMNGRLWIAPRANGKKKHTRSMRGFRSSQENISRV